MRRGLAILALTVLTHLCGQTILGSNLLAQEPARETSVPVLLDSEPSQLLISSYLSGRNFTPQQRTFQLILLSEAAIKIEPSLARLWSQEAFQLAFTLPMGWNRVAHEKNALAALAQVDPILAFELFGSMDATVPTASGDVPEDLRAYGARTVFLEFWKRKGLPALDDIRRQAERLGETGQYPFWAMSPIILDIDRQDHLKAQSLFGEALTYYNSGLRTESTDEEFSVFLNDLWEVIPRPLKQQALQLAVAHLSNEPKPSERKAFLGRTYSGNRAAEFRSRARQLLYSLLPRIREMDPNWAERIVEGHPDLKQAAGGAGPGSFSQEVMIENPTGTRVGDVSALQAAALQRLTLRRIASLAETDPDQALALTASLTDIALHDEALAIIAARLGSRDRQRAKPLIEQVEKDFDSIRTTPEKLRISVVLATAAGVNHDQKVLLQALDRGFDLGEELFSEDMQVHPGKPTYDVSGFNELSELTALGVKFARETTLARVARISNDLLRAHLLVNAAEALFAIQSAGRSQH